MHHSVNTIAVALAAIGLAGAQNSSWNHNLFTSSPPVYPSRKLISMRLALVNFQPIQTIACQWVLTEVQRRPRVLAGRLL